ncbi:hypothetical protein ABT324_14160 [Saccharopolyspora sp. NPDC000359]|uniref:hypothetical protein n=1 Tax=Saccharopolyspora sp. NPDC000359 TaxID=3154251 RepID=UPI003316E680
MSSWADEQHGPMTVDDLERLPDDGYRYELVDGRLDVSPAPLSGHPLIEAVLGRRLIAGHAEDVRAPYGWR